jgi:hypothetical protein
MQLNIAPTNKHPVPRNLAEELGESLQENVRVAATTAALMSELGMPFEMTKDDEDAARKLFAQVDRQGKGGTKKEVVNPPSLYQGNVALKLSALLNEYDQRVVLDATQARTYITNRLLEISSCGEPKSELRALELLGKLSDVGAFTEKSEITITHRNSGDLRQVIQEKIERLLAGNVVDVVAKDLNKELGLDDGPTETTTSAENTSKRT